MCSNFYEILHLEQTENANYGYSAWTWGSWPKIIDSGKCGPDTEICFNFHEILQSGHIWYANYQYSTLDEWPRTKEKNFGKFCPKLEMCEMFMSFEIFDIITEYINFV